MLAPSPCWTCAAKIESRVRYVRVIDVFVDALNLSGLEGVEPPATARPSYRTGLETGATSTSLWAELEKMGLPVIFIDARHAKAALKMQINKNDRNDAFGIAHIMQCGWYKEVRF
jgi:transposase